MASVPPSSWNGGEIIVTARNTGPSYGFTVTSFGGGGSGGGDTSGSDQSAQQQAEREIASEEYDAKDTPCVTLPPTKAPLSLINRSAMGAAAAINRQDRRYEYNSIIYVDEFGGVGHTMPSSSGNIGNTIVELGTVPVNATIVGMIHNHPAGSGADQRFPSPADRVAVDSVIAKGFDPDYRFTTDQNLLLFLVDQSSGNVYVYDRANRAENHPSCTLN